MPVIVKCVHCGKRYSVPDEHAGKPGRCVCGARIEIPPPAPPPAAPGSLEMPSAVRLAPQAGGPPPAQPEAPPQAAPAAPVSAGEEPPAVGLAWHWLCPEALSQFSPQADLRTLYVEGAEITDIDVARTLPGCFGGSVMRRGKKVVASNVNALLAGGRKDVLVRWLASRTPAQRSRTPRMRALEQLLVRGDRQAARREVEQWTFEEPQSIGPVLFVAFWLDDQAEARRLAEAVAAGSWKPWHWSDLVRAWKGIFHDDAQAKRCLDSLQRSATDVLDCTSCAEAWMLFNQSAEADNCLRIAEEIAGRGPLGLGLASCARAAWSLFGDRAAVRRCLEGAAARAKYGFELCLLAADWVLLLDDRDEAARNVQRAAADAKDSSDQMSCSRAWRDALGNDDEARRCLDAAVRAAQNARDFAACASGHADWGDMAGAKLSLERATAAASDSLDHSTCADAWLEVFDDESRARGCMEAAERAAKSSLDFAFCAEHWHRKLGNHEQTRRCITQAEQRAASTSDWCHCARVWRDLLFDRKRETECQSRAERAAKTAWDWFSCLREAKNSGNRDRAGWCLARAEGAAKSDVERQSCQEHRRDLQNAFGI